jgi:hypothetical protein
MLARHLHDLLKWLFPALFGSFMALAALAVAASEIWQEAKSWTELTFSLLVSITFNPLSPWLAISFFVIWLLALTWSGHVVKAANSAPVSSVEPPTPITEGLQQPLLDMPPLKSHFSNDFKGGVGEVAIEAAFNQEIEFPDGVKIETTYNQELRFSSHAKFLVLYIPHCGRAISVAQHVAININDYLKTGEIGFAVGGVGAEETTADDLVFTGKVFIYHEDSLTLSQRGELDTFYRERGLVLQLRSSDYVRSCRESARANNTKS